MTKLTRLEVENFKRIVALDINLGGNVTELSGRNGSGKSSTLDAISVLFEGLADAPAVPIRKGCEQSFIRGVLGEIIVERKFRAVDGGKYTSSITLRTPDGARYPEPQKHLNALIGTHMLDPLDFIRMKPPEQFEVLRKFVPGVDFEKLDAENKRDYDRRTDVNRFVKEAAASASMIVVSVDTPEDVIDESALVSEIQSAAEHNAAIERRAANRSAVTEKIAGHRATAERLKAESDRLFKEMQRVRDESLKESAQGDLLQEKLDQAEPLPAPKDVSSIRAQVDAARATNKHVELRARKQQHENLAKKHEQESKQLTETIEARNVAKRQAIAEAKIPVPGIEFGEKVILLNGVPFAQASTAEQLRTAFALIIALNPKLRLAWIRDASLLDEESLAIIDQLSQEYDCQVLLETVRPTSKNAIVLEDGRVKASKDDKASAA